MGLMINCKEATDLISKKEEKKLSAQQNIKLLFHLFLCRVCNFFYKQNNVIISSVSLMQKKSASSLSTNEKEQMVEVLEKELMP
ncbi:MAG: hypothetical protein V9E96_18025 [Chitinophagaceae bacterium]